MHAVLQKGVELFSLFYSCRENTFGSRNMRIKQKVQAINSLRLKGGILQIQSISKKEAMLKAVTLSLKEVRFLCAGFQSHQHVNSVVFHQSASAVMFHQSFILQMVTPFYYFRLEDL